MKAMKPLLSNIKEKIIHLLEGPPPAVVIEEVPKNPKEMSAENLTLLKEVLSVPTRFRNEERMIYYLSHYLNEKGYESYIDGVGNVYATKGQSEHFPCVVAHIDTVHHLDPSLEVVQDDDILFAINQFDQQIGIGGDDKNGVYLALRMLEEFDNIKAAFFVSEEIGCLGSRASDDTFFENVGYVVQFDAPFDYMVTHYCDGTKLFELDGDFYGIAEPIILKYFGEKMQLFRHPYTDVSILKRKHDFSCINLSCGYYNMHSSSEYVKISDIENAFNLGVELIGSLGENLYYMEKQKSPY